MKASSVLGIIFSNSYDENISELTSVRTMGSVPFAGRYRLIDFVLSDMVNCGISKVGISTKANYQYLMDHVGSGKPGIFQENAKELLFFLPSALSEKATPADCLVEELTPLPT